MAALLDLCCCCGLSLSGEELYKDWDKHPAVQQYTFIRRLGEGGFSEVQLAQDKFTGRTVALKVIFLNRPGLTADQRKILAGEAKLIRMVAHPHIVRCLQVLETRRQQVLVLEHLSGGEMLQQLQRVKRYTEAHACQLFRQVVDVVAYLHSLGIMHRDIKPENCLLAKPAQHYTANAKPVKVKVIDLGMAGLYRPGRPLYGCMGSPGFIAPEVVLGDAHTPAMDVYSLGVLLFVMLVGRKPWDSQRSHTLQYAVHSTAEAPGLADPGFLALSQPVQQLLLAMLGEAPDARPSAAQVLQHQWLQQGAQGAGRNRLILPTVQQRLRVLGNSREVMGTARGMLLLHSRGSRSGAVAFHKAVKEARLKLQQQAAALKAAGQLQHLEQLQQLQHPLNRSTTALLAADGAVGSSNSMSAQVAAPAADTTATAAAAAAAKGGIGVTAGQGGATLRTAGSPAAANAKPLGRASATIGQLARASLTQQSLLFDSRRRSKGSTPAAAATGAAGDGINDGSSRSAAAQPGAENQGLAGAPGAGCSWAVIPDAELGVMCDALERGISLPNPEMGPLLSDAYQQHRGAYRADRAVSMSPNALALLDADDRLCLLAAGTSADDGNTGWGAFSWAARRSAADMAASFKHHYPIRPLARSITRLGQSLTSSISRSLRHSTAGLGFASSICSGQFAPATAAADGSSPAFTSGFERCPSTGCSHAFDSDATSPAAVCKLTGPPSGAGCGSGDQSAEGGAEGCSRVAGDEAAAPASKGGNVVAQLHSSSISAACSTFAPGGLGLQRPPDVQVAAAGGKLAGAGTSSGAGLNRRAPVSGITKASMSRPFAAQAPQAAAQLNGAGAELRRTTAVGDGRSAPAQLVSSGSGVLRSALSASTDMTGEHSMSGEYLAFLGTALSMGTDLSMSPPLSPDTETPAGMGAGPAAAGGAGRVQHQLANTGRGSTGCGGSAAGHSSTVQLAPAAAASRPNPQQRRPHVAGPVDALQQAQPRQQQQPPVAPQAARATGVSWQHEPGKEATSKYSRGRTPFDDPATAAAVGGPLEQQQQQQLAGSAAQQAASGSRGGTRSPKHSPSMRAAATAAAARAEEEGLSLPNGLWLPLQSSQSLDTTFALMASALAPALSAASSAWHEQLQGIGSLNDVAFLLKQDDGGDDEEGNIGGGTSAGEEPAAAAAGMTEQRLPSPVSAGAEPSRASGAPRPGSASSLAALGLPAGEDAGAATAAACRPEGARSRNSIEGGASTVEAAESYTVTGRLGGHQHMAVPHLGRQHGLQHGSRLVRSSSTSSDDPAGLAGTAAINAAAAGSTMVYRGHDIAADHDSSCCSRPAADEAGGEGASSAGRGSSGPLSSDFYVGSFCDGGGLEEQLDVAGSRLDSAEAAVDEDGGDRGAGVKQQPDASAAGNGVRGAGKVDADDALLLLFETGANAAGSSARGLSINDADTQSMLPGVTAHGTVSSMRTPSKLLTAIKEPAVAAPTCRAAGGQAPLPLVISEHGRAAAAASGSNANRANFVGGSQAEHKWQVKAASKSACAVAVAFDAFDEPTAVVYAE